MNDISRDTLGRIVRLTWVTWAQQQPNPKISWLLPFDALPPEQQEVDRLIGEAVRDAVLGKRNPTTSAPSINPITGGFNLAEPSERGQTFSPEIGD